MDFKILACTRCRKRALEHAGVCKFCGGERSPYDEQSFFSDHLSWVKPELRLGPHLPERGPSVADAFKARGGRTVDMEAELQRATEAARNNAHAAQMAAHIEAARVTQLERLEALRAMNPPLGSEAQRMKKAQKIVDRANRLLRNTWLEYKPEDKRALSPGARTADEFLQHGIDLLRERGKQYDQPDGERSMGKTVAAFNAITDRDLSEAEGWLLMLVLKQVRQWQTTNYHKDSAEDAVSYSALLAEALKRGEGK